MQEQIGFDTQGPLTGTCAQRSLIHSLLLLGIPISEQMACRRTGVPKWKATFIGTTATELMKGMRRCNCLPYDRSFDDPDEAKEEIEKFLSIGMPVIIDLPSDDHFMVLAGKQTEDRYFWVDSDDEELYGSDNWKDVKRWMEGNNGYDFIGVRPFDNRQLSHSLVSEFGKVYKMFDDDELAEYWGVYLEDLTEIFDCPKGGRTPMLPEEFFSSHGDQIVDSVSYYHGNVDLKYVKWELQNYENVAISHQLSLSRNKVSEGLVRITAALSMLV